MPIKSNQYDRTDRIGEEMRRGIDRIIREELDDPRIGGTYSITRVDVTRDLRWAKVRVSVLEPERRVSLMEALKAAQGYVRRALGKDVQLRYTPELIFELDTNIEYGVHIAKVIDEVRADEKKRDGDD